MTPLLTVERLEAGYGDLRVLRGVDLEVHEGEVVSVVGANGAGKTTLLNAIAGTLPPTGGRVLLEGEEISGRPAHGIVSRGLALVPEGRRLFPFLTVQENLRLGAYHREARRRHDETLAEVLELFPILAERRDQLAGSLSGGEQQMCALGRGLMSRPKLLMLDEPSLGLAPIIVEQVFALIPTLVERGVTVLIVEQNVAEALELSTRANVLEQGRVALTGTGTEFLEDERLRAAYLGAG
jgi:branched-chain amino acid transport system ATP-binding protein